MTGPLIRSLLLIWATLITRGSVAQDCGLAPMNTIKEEKVVGGVNATPGSWPWQASIHLNVFGTTIHICGGTLISDQWILTAAHCILVATPSAWTIYLGRETQSGPNANEVSRTVSQIIIHPNYNNTLFNNDIALMKLNSPVTFTNYTRPICLANASSQIHNATLCYATGWGKLSNTTNLPASTPLQQVQVPVIGPKQCSCSFSSQVDITSEMICAGEANKGTCQGDSGGPLQCQQGGKWIQAGITSFGVPCARPEFPEVYARVSEFQQWVTDNVAGANVSFALFSSSGTDPDNNFTCNFTSITTSAASLVIPQFVVLSVVVAFQHIVT
ncbi:chymotrypsin-like protease CTRL-1 [Takifugu flavidus]|uniref:Plasma kallikrein n=1 Tax=Takifugu flavidus TaxID=433684 RepID=A0A5C6PPC1_9TELE|nr:chymotrypsin-like protease CTRL-1 [Takifugu flavidus]XP_056882501.1 chymotrypsin-like protease CTRL-1 [Takifugu flavidus]TWW81333.1 Plasma kallikrein [Takifugu flavidus]